MQQTAASQGIVMYSGERCYYCVRARDLLERKGVAYREIKVDVSPEQRAEMERRSKRRTIPQIFINELHIGGFDDMAALDRAGELDPLLEPFKAGSSR
jgi:glutaredoxin 3